MRVLKRFWKFVEIPTKLVSLFAFATGLVFAFLTGSLPDARLMGLYFCSMLLFDMTCTAVNNTADAKRAGLTDVFGFPYSAAVVMIALMLIAAAAAGLLLAVSAGPVVFWLGVFCFAVGILYNCGPIPFCRMPLGEVLSGGIMGFFIPLIFVCLDDKAAPLKMDYSAGTLSLSANIPALLGLALFCGPIVCATANIMLANNICDVEDDVRVRRYTLPYYIGKKASLRLFAALYAAGLAAGALAFLAGTPSVTAFFGAAVCAPVVLRNTRRFFAEQAKAKTFPLCIQNFAAVNTMFLSTAVLGGIFR